MAASFFFYDLETSGFDPRQARIMQFAGQRTDMDLKPIGDPVNVLIKLSPDTLPDPDAVLITGITPQQTLADGISEVEFLRMFHDDIATPDTIMTGYNSVRFDDEFMRCLQYRNFYDPYEWAWKDGRSRWDLLDVVRMTRALRPVGIEWPFAPDGKPSNRLEYLTTVNKLDHAQAHDALSDVIALIEVSKLLKSKQPDLFKYLLDMRDKKKVKALVSGGQPFVYTSGKYDSAYEKTTVAMMVASHTAQDAALVYDLRHDPTPFMKMSLPEIVKAWQYSKDPDAVRLPVKTLKYNRCPAVAPLGVFNDDCQKRLQLDLKTVEKHRKLLQSDKSFVDKLLQALEQMDAARPQAALISDEQEVDGQIYDGFFDDNDRNLLRVVRAADPAELGEMQIDFHDDRLKLLLPLYKARNYLDHLTPEQREAWESFRHKRLLDGGNSSRMAKFFKRLQELDERKETTQEQRYLLEELQLYGQSILPEEAFS